MDFSAWYILFIVWVDGNGMHSAAAPKVDLQTCKHDAVRAMAALPDSTAKWSCHEMTINIDDKNIEVRFPKN